MDAVLLAEVEQQLQPEADAQARPARADGLDEGLAQPGPAQLGDGVPERPDAGQHDLPGAGDAVRVGRDLGAWPTASNAFWTLRRLPIP